MFSKLHERAVRAARNYRKSEAELIPIIMEIDATEEYRALEHPSLYTYVNQELKLSEGCTQQMILVSRKSRTVPQLMHAIARDEFGVSKAKTIVSVITPENQEEWIEKARTLSTRELEKEVAKARPHARKRDCRQSQGNGYTRVNLSITDDGMGNLDRVLELMAQKKQKVFSLAEAVEEMAKEYIKKQDPVAKADQKTTGIIHVKTKVHKRDRGECQYRMPNGSRCRSKHFIDIHHIKPKSEGGPDTIENLITLCKAHHRMVHAH